MNTRFIGVSSGPCPKCGGSGSVPDGLYDAAEDTLNLVSTWPQDRIDRLIEGLREAKTASDPLAATKSALAQEQELWIIANRLLIPTNPAEFWAFVAALFAILMYFKG